MIPTVLLIEDEPTLARNMCFFLEREGMAVEMAFSGEAGLELLAQFKPQVVLLDHGLPGIDGLEVLSRIMARAPHTRVIMLSDSGSEQTAVAALKGGAADYLKKPMELAALRLVIDRALGRRRSEDVPEGRLFMCPARQVFKTPSVQCAALHRQAGLSSCAARGAVMRRYWLHAVTQATPLCCKRATKHRQMSANYCLVSLHSKQPMKEASNEQTTAATHSAHHGHAA